MTGTNLGPFPTAFVASRANGLWLVDEEPCGGFSVPVEPTFSNESKWEEPEELTSCWWTTLPFPMSMPAGLYTAFNCLSAKFACCFCNNGRPASGSRWSPSVHLSTSFGLLSISLWWPDSGSQIWGVLSSPRPIVSVNSFSMVDSSNAFETWEPW